MRTHTVTRDALVAAQKAEVARLTAELEAFKAEGNEYYAMLTEGDLVAARSLARLVHKSAEAT